MLQDIISLLGIANPQLALAWQDGGLPTENTASPVKGLVSSARLSGPSLCFSFGVPFRVGGRTTLPRRFSDVAVAKKQDECRTPDFSKT